MATEILTGGMNMAFARWGARCVCLASLLGLKV